MPDGRAEVTESRGAPRPRPVGLSAVVAVSIVAVLLGTLPGVTLAYEVPGQAWFTLTTRDGEIICQTGFSLSPGDEYTDEWNQVWVVEEVVGRTAVARLDRILDLSRAVEEFRLALEAGALAQGGRPQIGLYHTHSDESYVPSDGSESDPGGHGGVYQVGEAFAKALKANGLAVRHDQTNHLPHDAGAYERSRRTATQVLQGSTAIFDVHRDAAPPEAYGRQVSGRRVTQIMLVVGRANPGAGANQGFAEALKAAADRVHPGLVRGILRTGGDFNQDLSGRALLLEVGAHTNRREEAERAVTLLASVVPEVLGAGPGPQSVSAWRTAGLILGAVVVGGGLWLYVATGGDWRAAWNKLRSLGEEFASYLGRRPPRG